MAKYSRVRFLKYFNRPRVFVAMEIDTIAVFAGSAGMLFTALSLSSILSPYFSFMSALISAGFIARFYTKYKAEASKGFLRHSLYVLHLQRVNEKSFEEETKRMDVDNYYPNPNEKLFVE